MGDVTVALARTGADVVALEPNPHAFSVLEQRCARLRNVRCLQVAASTQDGIAPLYLHQDAADDAIAASAGSSLLAEKRNVDPTRSIQVSTVDLDRLLAQEAPVEVLKLDIEGAEIDVLAHLLDTGRLREIGLVLVEMHDWHTERLTRRGRALRERLTASGCDNVRLDWR